MPAQFLVLTHSEFVPNHAVDKAIEHVMSLGGVVGSRRQLSQGAVEVAFECTISVVPPQIPDIDANVIPANYRQKKLLVADMDSTIISVECIDELADYAGVKDQVAAITEQAMRGELDFEAALQARVRLLAGLPESALEQCFRERVKLNPGAQKLVETMNANGAQTALISGGFTYFSARVAGLAGFVLNRANALVIKDGILTGTVEAPIIGRLSKRDTLVELRLAMGIKPQETLAVGDGANDLAMMSEAGLGVAYRAKSAIKKAAGAVVDHSDLTALLAFQGYRRQTNGFWSL